MVLEISKHPTVKDSVESTSSLGSRRKRLWVGLFSTVFSSQWCTFHKCGKWWQTLHLNRHENFKPLLHIALARRTKRFTLYCAGLITCTLRILFCIVSRGDWLGNPANIKVENSGVVIYVGSSLTMHNPLFSVRKL